MWRPSTAGGGMWKESRQIFPSSTREKERTFRKREIKRGGRATERSENLEETWTRIESLSGRGRGNKTSREEQLEKRWKGWTGWLICVYACTSGRGGGRREERVNLSVGAALPRGDPHSRPRFYCFQPRRYTKLLVLSAR